MTGMLGRIVLLVALLVCVSACGTVPTYVNIPAQDGDQAFHNPNSEIVRQLVSMSAYRVVEDTPITGPVTIALPAGTTKLTYAAVLPKIGDLAIEPYYEGVEPDASLTIAAIRIRGERAEVDIVRRLGDDPAQLVVVSLKWKPFSNWFVTGHRTWRTLAEHADLPVIPAEPIDDVTPMEEAAPEVDAEEAAEEAAEETTEEVAEEAAEADARETE